MAERFSTASLLAAALLSSACAGGGTFAQHQAALAEARSDLSEAASPPAASEGLHLDLVKRLVDRGACRAALAHLDARAPGAAEPDEAHLLRAECRRKLGDSEAAREGYEALLGTPLAAQAHRGLGLLAAASQRLPEAVEHLETARRLAPTDARIRNDLGYALLRLGREDEAREELATAVELAGVDSLAARNLVLLLLTVGDDATASQLSARAGLQEEELGEIRARAELLRDARPAVSAGPPASETAPTELEDQGS
jgi:tetratricopeptide (TPR) repeat protein